MRLSPDYRPDIDGLRAVAVLSVLLFHYGFSTLSGGFAGVDIFFVISGYLITKHLAEDIASNGHAVIPLLIRFYNKRIRRIIPALAVVLITTLVAAWLILMPGDYATTSESTVYAAFGLGNVFFYFNTGYFDREAELQPLLHTWSLGVEEQFYVFWPLILSAIIWAARDRRGVITALMFLLLAVAFGFGIYTAASDPKAAFYLPHARAWELAAGALIAFLPAVRNRLVSEAVSVAGVALIAWSLLTLKGDEQSLGLAMMPAVAGSALLIWPRTPTLVSAVLGFGPIRFIGLISYSLYLWHWPILVLFRVYANGNEPTALEALALAACAFGLATLSWKYVETPVRQRRMPPLRMIGAGLASVAAVAGLAGVIIFAQGFPGRIPENTRQVGSLEQMFAWPKCVSSFKPKGSQYSHCNFGERWGLASNKTLVFGDSHAEMFAPLIDQANSDPKRALLLYRTCPPMLGGSVKWPGQRPGYDNLCQNDRKVAADLLRDDKSIDTVFVIGYWTSYIPYVESPTIRPGKLETGLKALEEGLTESLANLAAARQVVVIGDTPSRFTTRDPVSCYLAQTSGLLRRPCTLQPNEEFRAQQARTNEVVAKTTSKFTNTTYIPGFPALCENGNCLTELNGEFLYRDDNHFRRNLSEVTLKELAVRYGLANIRTADSR